MSGSSLYGMQGLGTTGLGVGSAGQIPQASPLMMSSLMQGGGMAQQPGSAAMSPMAQYIQMQQHGMGAPMQPPQPAVMPQGMQPGQGGQSPMAGLLAQLNPSAQQGVQQPGQQPPMMGGQPNSMGGMMANALHGYTPRGYGMNSGLPSPQMLQQLQGQAGMAANGMQPL